jgi:suppressor for copper-sensitivity B
MLSRVRCSCQFVVHISWLTLLFSSWVGAQQPPAGYFKSFSPSLILSGLDQSGLGITKQGIPELENPPDAELSQGYRPDDSKITWFAIIQDAELKPGQETEIVLRAQVASGYHLYTFMADDTETLNRTLIVASQKSLLQVGRPVTKTAIVTQNIDGLPPISYYQGSIEWRIPIRVPDDAPLTLLPIQLLIGFNACDQTHCDPPVGLQIDGIIKVVDHASSTSQSMTIQTTEYDQVAKSPLLGKWPDNQTGALGSSTREMRAVEPLRAWMILAALAGGFILNFMPCVLPVVGLKLMSFVKQAGSSRLRIIQLNLAFVAGIMLVVVGLAALNIGAKLAGNAVGWGEQFNSFPLQISIVVLLFAMALSFLGVWEIPIPGFATSQKAGELLQQEGLGGAFFKGVLTTLLATPCSGPLLGAVFGETLKLSTMGSLLVFISVGMGLSMPYLAVCIWPATVRWLPKPGPWMDTLKQFLAFPLLLSMIWFLNVIDSQYHIAMLILLIGVWFGCWLAGQVPAYAEIHVRTRVWAVALAVMVLAGMTSFRYFGPVKHYLPWQPFSENALAVHRNNGQIVLIEFTAKWCLACQTNMRLVIDRPEIAEVIKQNNVATLLADWTDTSINSVSAQAIRKKIQELDSNSIPLLAIYPADPTRPPIILRDLITRQQLLAGLNQAGVSQKSASSKTTGNRQVR